MGLEITAYKFKFLQPKVQIAEWRNHGRLANWLRDRGAYSREDTAHEWVLDMTWPLLDRLENDARRAYNEGTTEMPSYIKLDTPWITQDTLFIMDARRALSEGYNVVIEIT